MDKNVIERVSGVQRGIEDKVLTEEVKEKEQVKEPIKPVKVESEDSSLIVDVKLPSLGKPYDIGEMVNIRPMRTSEEKYFGSMAGAASAHKILGTIVKACSDLPIDSIDLLMDDRLYLLFKIRSITYDNIYKIDIPCDSCNRKFIHSFDIEQAEVHYLDGDVFFEVELPINKDTLLVRRLNGRDEISLIEYEKQLSRIKRGKKSGDVDADNTYIRRLVTQIVRINDKEVSILDRERYVEKMHGKDSLTFRNAIDDHILGFSLELMMECTFCGADNFRIMPMTPEFFRPRL